MSEFERLRALLLSDEHARLAQQQQDLADLKRSYAELPEALPELLEAADRGAGRQALHRALAPVVAAALSDAVRRDRRSIVDALFPIIGPSIRKAIAEALRSFVVDLNRAVEQSLSLRGWIWRLEAWRSGVPYSQVLLKHTLRYRIDHLFLIERESGLLLHRYTAPELPDLDSDAIAGMLTAIGDFVRDSVQAGDSSDGGLASATVGEHLLQVHEGPIAVLACFIRGVAPAALTVALRSHLEDLHRERDELQDAPDRFDWGTQASARLDIAALAQFGAPALPPRPARWPVVVLLLLLIFATGWGLQQHWRRSAEAHSLRALVQATPGWQWLELNYDGGWQLRLLRDPDAASIGDLASRAGLDPARLQVHSAPYLALDDPLLALRLTRALQPPAGVSLTVRAGVAKVSGSADANWATQARSRALLLPGIVEVDFSELTLHPNPAWLDEYTQLRAQTEQTRLRFARGQASLEPAAGAALGRQLGRALELARMLDRSLAFELRGWTDESGSEQQNQRLREQRAQALQAALVASGVPAAALRTAASDHNGDAPFADLRWIEDGHE